MPFAAGAGKRLHVHFRPTGFFGGVRQKVPVGRKLRAAFAKPGSQKRLCLAVAKSQHPRARSHSGSEFNEGEQLPLWRERTGLMIVVTGCQPLWFTTPVRQLPEQISRSPSAGAKHEPLAIRRPGWEVVATAFKRHPRQRPSSKIVNPNIAALFRYRDSHTSPVGRNSRVNVKVRWGGQRLLCPIPMDPYQAARVDLNASRNVDQRSRLGNAILGGSGS